MTIERISMNLFVLIWGLISPVCLSLVAGVLWINQSFWTPGDSDIWRSSLIWLGYWLPLGGLQAALLLWKFRDRRFAYQWWFVTSLTGFLIMLVHELYVLSTNPIGQGILVLLLTLPILAVMGGLVLGAAQFLLIRRRSRSNLKRLRIIWFVLCLLSWVIGFGGLLLFFYGVVITVAATVLKGWFLQKYLVFEQND